MLNDPDGPTVNGRLYHKNDIPGERPTSELYEECKEYKNEAYCIGSTSLPVKNRKADYYCSIDQG